MQAKGGPILYLGITDGNLRRLRAGMPIDVDVDELVRQAGMGKIVRLVIAHGRTHVDCVRDMEQGGLPVPPALMEHARELDAARKERQ